MSETTPSRPNPLKEGKETSEGKLASRAGWVSIVMMVAGLITAYLPSLQEGMAETSHWYAICGMSVTIAGLVAQTLVSLGYAKSRTAIKVPLLEALQAENKAKGAAVQRAALADARKAQAELASANRSDE